MNKITQFIAKKFIEKEREKIELAMATYGSVIVKDGRVLTVKEMENLKDLE